VQNTQQSPFFAFSNLPQFLQLQKYSQALVGIISVSACLQDGQVIVDSKIIFIFS